MNVAGNDVCVIAHSNNGSNRWKKGAGTMIKEKIKGKKGRLCVMDGFDKRAKTKTGDF